MYLLLYSWFWTIVLCVPAFLGVLKQWNFIGGYQGKSTSPYQIQVCNLCSWRFVEDFGHLSLEILVNSQLVILGDKKHLKCHALIKVGKRVFNSRFFWCFLANGEVISLYGPQFDWLICCTFVKLLQICQAWQVGNWPRIILEFDEFFWLQPLGESSRDHWTSTSTLIFQHVRSHSLRSLGASFAGSPARLDCWRVGKMPWGFQWSMVRKNPMNFCKASLMILTK